MTVQALTRLPERASPVGPARDAFAAFAGELFHPLARADQRRWAAVYLHGLLAAPGKKSIRRLAAAAGDPAAAQALQQFVNASPWDWSPVREALLRWAVQRTEPLAWTVEAAVAPKRGDFSAGVHRRFVPSLGRIVNCQTGVGVFLADSSGQVPVDWRLLLPGRWSEDDELRARTRIPADAQGATWPAQVLGLVDSLALRSPLRAPVVVDMGHDRQADAFVRALLRRRYDFVLAVPRTTALHAVEPQEDEGREGTSSAGVLQAGALLAEHGRTVSTVGGHGVAAARTARVTTCLVRLPGPRSERSLCRLFASWSPAAPKPRRVWLTNLAQEGPERLLTLSRAQERTAASVDALTDGFGLSDFEGRSYPGWHHHMTLVSAAYAYSRLVGRAGNDGLARMAAA